MFAVAAAARHFEALSTRALASDDLSFLGGMILAALFFERSQGTKPSDLADTFATSRGNISHCISALEARGWLQRKIDPEDARAYLLTLTPQGRKCALRVISTFDRLQKSFENALGRASLRELLKNLRRLAEATDSLA